MFSLYQIDVTFTLFLADAGSAMPQFEEGILDSEQLVTSYDTAESVDVISSQRPAAAAGKATAATATAAPSLLRHATPKKPVAVAGSHTHCCFIC